MERFKANMMEIGIAPFGYNKHHGHCKNPYDIECDTGGSSSGSACAVSAGIVPAAIGADGGGSIRIPASFCGVVGIKPQHGRVPETGAFPLCSSVGHLGPIATCVADAQAILQIIKGSDGIDMLSEGLPVEIARRERNASSLRGWRVGVCKAWAYTSTSSVIRAHFDKSVELLEKLGATIVPFKFPCFDQVRLAHTGSIIAEMSATMRDHQQHLHKLMSTSAMALQIASMHDSAFFVTAQKLRTFIIQHCQELFEEQGVDVLVTPTTGCVAPRFHNGRDMNEGISDFEGLFETMLFAQLGNFTGIPGISVPNGFDPASGLPTAFQIMSRPFAEDDAAFIAHVVESHTALQRPKIFFEPLKK